MRKAVLFFAAAFIFFSFSCTDFPDGEICPGGEGVTRVDVGVTSSQEIGGGGRSILPSAFDGGGYEYYLFYIDTLSSSASGYSFYGTVSLSYISQTEATASVEFRPSVYRFVLYACPSHLSSPSEAEAKSAAVLSGATVADIRSVRKILFYLDSETLSAKGTVSVDMDSLWAFPDGWDFSDGSAFITVGLYDKNTGKAVSSMAGNPYRLSYPSDVSDTIHLEDFSFGGAEIMPGAYDFIVRFANARLGTQYEWSDDITIVPNRTTAAEISVPNVIEEIPSPPSSFSVSVSGANDDSDFYTAFFSWNDDADNETGFEIEIADVSSWHSNLDGVMLMIPDVSDDASWDDTVSEPSYAGNDVNVYDEKSYSEYISHYYGYFGNSADFSPDSYSLKRNSTRARFFLQLGRRYIARIRSVGDAGKSAWVYGDFDSGGINVFRLSYMTDSGSFSSYESQSASGVPVDFPASPLWKSWRVSSGTGASYPADGSGQPVPYTGHANLYLVGEYDASDDGSSAYDWADGDVILYGWGNAGGNVYFGGLSEDESGLSRLCDEGQFVSVSKSSVGTLRWELSPSAKSYSSVTLSIRKSTDDAPVYSQLWDTSTKVWTVDASSLDDGIYIATFAALSAAFPGKEFIFSAVVEITD